LKISDKKRIYLSGYAKRKLKKETEDLVSKLSKLTNLFKTVNSVNEVEANTNNKDDLVLNNSYLDVENMNNDSIMSNTIITSNSDALNFSENETDNCSAVENSVIATNFNSDVYNFEIYIESYQNPGMWPLVLNNTFIELCCLKRPAFFQNMDPKKFHSSKNEI
jgi:hypothetical protein